MKSLIILLLVSAKTIIAQNNLTDKVKAIIDKQVEAQETVIDYSQLEDDLLFLSEHKLDLNKVTEDDLLKLPIIQPKEARAIINHRKKYGDYLSLLELQTIPELSSSTIDLLKEIAATNTTEFITKPTISNLFTKGKSTLFVLEDKDLEKRKGYLLNSQGKTPYTGNPFRYMVKYRYQFGTQFGFGYQGEKDPGEAFFIGAQSKGFDFNSMHLFYKPTKGIIRYVTVGDYQLNCGQGLTFATGINMGKSAYVLNVMRNFNTLSPNKSLNESNYLRGFSFTANFKNFYCTPFVSFKKMSASVFSDSSINNIQAAGLHRTESEINGYDKLAELIYGLNLQYKKGGNHIAFTAVKTRYNLSFTKKEKLYQLYQFTGNQFLNIGIDYTFNVGNVLFYGEASNNLDIGISFLNGLIVSLDKKLDLVIHHRHFINNYQVIYSNAFAANSDSKNEEGIYFGLTYQMNTHWKWSSFVDIYESKWLRYQMNAPSKGSELFSELSYQLNKTDLIYLRLKSMLGEKNNLLINDVITYPYPFSKFNSRLNFNYQITPQLKGETRIATSTFSQVNTPTFYGSLIHQDIKWKHPSKQLSLQGRISYFTIDDFQSRIYESENDVLYQYAVPVFQNKGMRYYAMLEYRLNALLTCWIKYAYTSYYNIDKIGSGNEEIAGNKLEELRAQLRITF